MKTSSWLLVHMLAAQVGAEAVLPGSNMPLEDAVHRSPSAVVATLRKQGNMHHFSLGRRFYAGAEFQITEFLSEPEQTGTLAVAYSIEQVASAKVGAFPADPSQVEWESLDEVGSRYVLIGENSHGEFVVRKVVLPTDENLQNIRRWLTDPKTPPDIWEAFVRQRREQNLNAHTPAQDQPSASVSPSKDDQSIEPTPPLNPARLVFAPRPGTSDAGNESPHLEKWRVHPYGLVTAVGFFAVLVVLLAIHKRRAK